MSGSVRESLPKVNGAGVANALGSNQRYMPRSLPDKLPFRRRFGREPPSIDPVRFCAVVITSGKPLCKLDSVLKFQPPTRAFIQPPRFSQSRPLPAGNCQMKHQLSFSAG